MSGPSPDPLRVALVGAGSVGTAVAHLLKVRGHTITGVASRSEASAGNAARRLGAKVFDQTRAVPADLVLLGVPESAIEDAASDVARWTGPGCKVVHFAGAVGVAPLGPVTCMGALPAALHPVQACPDVDTAIKRLPGCAWGVTCSDGVRDWSHRLITDDLAGLPVDVAEDDRVVWHAAAVSTSNAIAGMMAVGESLLRSIGIGSPTDILGPIASATVINALEAGGGSHALTGPVVRGERHTIERHARAIAQRAPELLSGYLDAARVVLEAARSAGRVDDAMAAEIEQTLKEASTWT
jgi:predicted short-subunit dehydrogenase-like oxidoreductase (DUF2520 family)